MLEGRGVRVTDVPFIAPRITSANLSQWVKPSWTTQTNAIADKPNAIPITQLIDAYFAKKG